MEAHSRAFTLVDKITTVEPGVRIRGHYRIPPTLEKFPSSLVAEATGQLAGWAIMAAVDFRFRCLAGIAEKVELLAEARPGQLLELAADIQSVSTDACDYCGSASIDGQQLLRLTHCVGPMLPQEELEDVSAVRGLYLSLCSGDSGPSPFGGVPSLDLTRTGGEPGQIAKGVLNVPTAAEFFADHFPRRALFPATLLVNEIVNFVTNFANEESAPGTGFTWVPRGLYGVKIRAFTNPGETLDVVAEVKKREIDSLLISVEVRNGQRSAANLRMALAKEETG
jgi:3-hydroxymyristoyl/3-hydroxydecanoyl-(acyl carrier protein) dehydratase